MLSVENLTYHYKGRPAVLKDVNFKVNTGEFLAILGNNGVGKSTMLKCFNKILTPDDGKIILDKNGMGGWLKKNVLDYIERIPLKTEEDISQEIKWCEKMLLRTMRGDVEGYYRWHWVLCDSLEIYFDIKGIHYYGPKKALHFMEESDSEAFHIYSKALLEFNQEGLSDWINYLKTIF